MSYNQFLLELFENPTHLADSNPAGFSVESSNPVCGDQIELWIDVQDGRLQTIVHRSQGCPPAIAVGELICRALEGASRDTDLLAIVDLEKLEPLPANKRHAVSLAKSLLKKLKAAIADG
jgi:NifU-like protein involved in Fe-S cluster formation